MPINKIAPQVFDEISRGTSITIPVIIKRVDDTPFDLTGFQIFFTIKSEQWNFDYDDLRTAVNKEVLINNPESGEFFINLSSEDTYHNPGSYFFDIEMVNNGAVGRLGIFKFDIVGGPTNRTVNISDNPMSMTNGIHFTIGRTNTIAVVAPLISKPPKDLIETIICEPEYLMEVLDPIGEPIRNIKIKSYAPYVSFAMCFTDLHDALPHYYAFENFSFSPLPADCPFAAGGIEIDNRKIKFFLSDPLTPMTLNIWDTFVQFSPEETHGGSHIKINIDEDYFVGDNAAHGSLNIFLKINNKKYAHIVGNYAMPRHLGDISNWMFRIDYFNWN